MPLALAPLVTLLFHAARWSFSGIRLIAGGTFATANLVSQLAEHEANFGDYNWGSIGYDYVMGAIGYSFSKYIFTRWPAPMLVQLRSPQAWVNFVKQQGAFTMYQTILGAARSVYSNTEVLDSVLSCNASAGAAMIRSQVVQNLVFSEQGKKIFPKGYGDKRVVFAVGVVSVLTDAFMREVFDAVPKAD